VQPIFFVTVTDLGIVLFFTLCKYAIGLNGIKFGVWQGVALSKRV
jgi:hypothetical protein